uniref:Putative LAGLIDADG homing endonuclease n=1 Tax=Rhexinema sarcinoideum TaxID=43261 RepID=A0A1B2RYW2_9CHLO|nr:putative LAGLIDADG homing endonuclease [Rhexinema sarcinoideum]
MKMKKLKTFYPKFLSLAACLKPKPKQKGEKYVKPHVGLVIKLQNTKQFASSFNFVKKPLGNRNALHLPWQPSRLPSQGFCSLSFSAKGKPGSETKREAQCSQERWAVGLIDGDGHIGMERLGVQKWGPCLKVTLANSNARAIYRLKKILGVGRISRSQKYISLRVRNVGGWEKLQALFSKFPLKTDKYYAAQMVFQSLHFKKTLLLESKAGGAAKVDQNSREFLNQTFKNWKENLKTMRGVPAPVWQASPEFVKAIREKPNLSPKTLLQTLSFYTPDFLNQILDPDWFAGFVEAEGRFYILKNGQHGFALGQAYNSLVVAGIHKWLQIKSALKIRQNLLQPYVLLNTKNQESLLKIASLLKNRMLGMKSFSFAVWLRTLRKKKPALSLKARALLHKINQRQQ